MMSEGGRLGRDGLWDPQEMWASGGMEAYSWCSIVTQEMRLGVRFGREKRVSLVYLFSWPAQLACS